MPAERAPRTRMGIHICTNVRPCTREQTHTAPPMPLLHSGCLELRPQLRHSGPPARAVFTPTPPQHRQLTPAMLPFWSNDSWETSVSKCEKAQGTSAQHIHFGPYTLRAAAAACEPQDPNGWLRCFQQRVRWSEKCTRLRSTFILTTQEPAGTHGQRRATRPPHQADVASVRLRVFDECVLDTPSSRTAVASSWSYSTRPGTEHTSHHSNETRR